MKNFKLISFVLLFSLIFIGCGDDKEETEKNTGIEKSLVAYYKFEGDAKDSSGNGNHGRVHGKMTYTNGVIGKAGNFDGIDDYIELPALDTDFKEISVSSWVYFDSPSHWGRIIDLSNGAGVDNILFAEDDITSNLCFEIYANSGNFTSESQKVEVLDGIYFGEWKHYTTVASKKNGKMEVAIYIDGVKQKTVNRDGDANTITNIPNNVKRTINYIGKSPWTTVDGYLNGLIDDLRVYNRALSSSEVKELFEMKK
jgi:hypothetical protein